MSDFGKIFENLSRVNDRTIVFMDFLDWVIAGFNINPHYEFQWRGKYSDDEKQQFLQLFNGLLAETREALDKGEEYYDFLGSFYEESVQARAKASGNGQFFTPHDVSKVLTELGGEEHDDVKTVYDCAAGSGRLLLAYHAKYPQDIIRGDELDEVSAKMMVINFMLHGVKGAVCCMNSLTREFYFGFKTNEMIEMTGGAPHCMDIDAEWMAGTFFGVPMNNGFKTDNKELRGQTTLM